MGEIDKRYLRRLVGVETARWHERINALEYDDSISPEDKQIIKKFYESSKRKAEEQYGLLGH